MRRSFKEALASGEFLVTAEVVPQKGIDAGTLTPIIKDLNDVVDALSVPDNPRALMSMSACAISRLILENGGDAIMHVSCRDRNRIALQSDLLGAAFLGIRNILCINGDHVRFGDHIDAMPVYDLDSVQLLETVRSLTQGRDMAGQQLVGIPDFCVGTAANPEADPLPPQLLKFEKKVQFGIDFVQTHPVFNIDNLVPFVNQAREKGVKLIAGVRLLMAEEASSYKDGSYPGLFIPEDLLAEIEGIKVEKSVEIAAQLIKAMREKKLCDGVHISAPGYEPKIMDIIKAAGI
ncbi:MAG: methylenetetrahydrofolate reductase [Deltaproteobacteria bacterium]|nr:methylenetetrahydrofolate reductase [Deltaproteobacteria bacterium]MBW1793231.1 methylenetetrahydrofolate reductase [Deltaproteobacteria bacterium]MBW2329511.1 methylenetetrahydrofolate reductase [Deltaproteobacteria bacterium]